MRVFTVNDDGKLAQYEENDFGDTKIEADLETLLENNPEYFFEGERVLIIGRQVSTNLGKGIDLLGLDESGNTVVIELKRGKTDRETVAQLLEYASFVDTLDYGQLNDIFQSYSGDEMELESYHSEYYEGGTDETVSFNKTSKLVIVAQRITPEIRQTALYLRRKGLDVYCVEFRYFKTPSDEEIITSDFVVGEEDAKKGEATTARQPAINYDIFINDIDNNGLSVFPAIFEYAEANNLIITWAAKGFTLSVKIKEELIQLFFGRPIDNMYGQSIHTAIPHIIRKVKRGEEIAEVYRSEIKEFGEFVYSGKEQYLRWIIDKPYPEEDIDKFLAIIDKVIGMIKKNGLKGP